MLYREETVKKDAKIFSPDYSYQNINDKMHTSIQFEKVASKSSKSSFVY
jgi:hypothetical protein